MSRRRHTLDEDSASRMLQGLVHPDDAPPGYASVAGLLSSAAQLPPLDEEAGAATIPAMVEVIRAGSPAAAASRQKSTLAKLFAGKVLAAVATVALTATGAAAATGSLPAPVQDAVAEAVSHVGVDLPAAGGKSADHRQDGEHRQAGEHGQSGEDHGRPADEGDGIPGDSGKGAVISELTHDPALDGLPKGPAVSDVASDGKSRAGEEPGKPAGDEGQAPAGEGEQHDDRPAPPVTTGGKATGEDRSSRDLEPQGQDKVKGDAGER